MWRDAMRKMLPLALFVMFGLLSSAPLLAHHGNAAYDYEATKTLKGTVTDWTWSNPHCILKLDVKDEKGEVTHWILETNSPVDMLRIGWTATSLKPGDEISVDIMPTKNGAPVGRVRKVILPDGKVLAVGGRYTL
jgi:hypothetical protein